MPIFKITFRANRLHEIGRPLSTFTKKVEARNSVLAINSLYHKYEHIKILEVTKE